MSSVVLRSEAAGDKCALDEWRLKMAMSHRHVSCSKYVHASLLCALVVGVWSEPVRAQWFGGPSNYNECMVEGMKGQDRSMSRQVHLACERKFEVELRDALLASIDISWNTTQSSLIYSVTKNDTDYAITRIIAAFSESPCDKPQREFKDLYEFNFQGWIPGADPKTEKEIEVSGAGRYRCSMKQRVFGIRKR